MFVMVNRALTGRGSGRPRPSAIPVTLRQGSRQLHAAHAHVLFGIGADLVDRRGRRRGARPRPASLKPNSMSTTRVDDEAGQQRRRPRPSALPTSCDQKLTPPMPPNVVSPKMPQAMPPHRPHRPCSGHTPSTSSICHLVGRRLEHVDEDDAGDAADDQRADRMHHVGAGAHGDEAGQRAVVDEAWIAVAGDQRRKDAAAHRHQRVDGDEAASPSCSDLRAHHVEAEPADAQQPRAHGEPRDRRRRDADGAALVVAAEPRPEPAHGARSRSSRRPRARRWSRRSRGTPRRAAP